MLFRSGEVDAKQLADMVRAKDEEIRKINEEEAAEFERIRKEEAEREAAELAKYDTDYMEEAESSDSDGEEIKETESGEAEADPEGEHKEEE